MAAMTAEIAQIAEPGSRARLIVTSRWFRVTAQLVVGGVVLVAVGARVGTAPFLHGLQSLDGRSIAAAVVLGAIGAGAAAWRWKLIAGRLGVGLRWPVAVGMYYRSLFLNSVLPGGVIGDAHRAIRHGRSADSIARASRAVVIERSAGQAVQLALALIVLAFFGAEFEGFVLTALAVGLVVLVAAGITAAAASARVRSALRRELHELRSGLGTATGFARVALASAIVVGCQIATFAVATTAVGASVPPSRLLAVALVILLAASLPINIGGWGPREGVAGWAFALAGFGAAAGVAASTLFGVLSLIAVAPGAIVLIAHRKGESS
jgi:uncharacterized membrane protein YbhN (UPF0104 family)